MILLILALVAFAVWGGLWWLSRGPGDGRGTGRDEFSASGRDAISQEMGDGEG